MNHTQSLYFLLFNVLWMGWNMLLALVPIYVSRLLQKSRSRTIDAVLFLLWLVFVPNTLYMVTDVIHAFSKNFNSMTLPFWIMGIGLYACVISLGVYTFVIATKPVLKKYHSILHTLDIRKRYVVFGVYASLVGFAISMGRFQRTNTWYIFTQPIRVVQDVITSLTDPTVLFMALCFSFGAFVIILLSARHQK